MNKIKLDDRSLWGNQAADDEDPQVLNSYFVSQKKTDWDDFFNLEDHSYSIARARKGMGKSALLKECAYRNKDNNSYIVIDVKGSDLIAHKNISDNSHVTQQIYDWQQRICAVINVHIAEQIDIAFSDDQILLVEHAELAGFRRKNLISSLTERLKIKISGFSLDVNKANITNHKELLDRVIKDKKILLLIDDIDATFKNTPEECLILSTFFSACREIAANFKGVSIRTVVRTDVWTCIRGTDEALDKVEQYIFDLNWNKKEFRNFFVERISSYCERKNLSFLIQGKNNDQIPSLIFEPKFPWGKEKINSYRVIHTYSGGRPRWAAQLCMMAGKETVKTNTSDVITFGAIKQVLAEYGKFRLDDIQREHNHQCKNIGQIINAFSRQKKYYSTSELLDFIGKKIFPNFSEIYIDGNKVSEELHLAYFLFRINFIIGVDKNDNNSSSYYTHEDKPNLLSNSSNLDDNMKWLIHPAYQIALSCIE